MKQFVFVIFAIALAFSFNAAPALACDGPDCDNVWVGGENWLDQGHNVFRDANGLGGQLGTGGYQGLDMWGVVHAPGQTGEYQGLGYQSEGADFVQDIAGGQIQTGHLATQLGQIDISGGNAEASVWGNNYFGAGTFVQAGATDNAYNQQSGNYNFLDMNGGVCLEGDGTASYTSEVLTQTGHTQNLSLPGGTAFTESLSQNRGYIKIEK